MSYSVNNPCWKCRKNSAIGGKCTDSQKLQEGVNKMYDGDGGHQGGGSILLSCFNLEPELPPERLEEIVAKDDQIPDSQIPFTDKPGEGKAIPCHGDCCSCVDVDEAKTLGVTPYATGYQDGERIAEKLDDGGCCEGTQPDPKE
jgi:hypothetical protein